MQQHFEEGKVTMHPEIMIDRQYSIVVYLKESRYFHPPDIMHQ